MRRALLSPRVLAVLLTSIALLTTAGGGVASAEHSAKGPSLSPRSSIELQTIIDVNNARAARGLGQLYADPTLGSLARERSTDMAANNYFSHYAPDGSAFYVQLLDSNHVQFQFAGENLAWSTYGDDVSAQTAVDGAAKKQWLSKTQCRSTYAMADCKGYKAPKTSTTTAPGTTAPGTTAPSTTTPSTTTTG